MNPPLLFGMTKSRLNWRASQRGVVLFFALVALVVMSLAAVALVRSVDTGTIIAGNLAFRQAATTSADGGAEQAFDWIADTDVANAAKDVTADATHAFNISVPGQGYYSFLKFSKSNLLDEDTWANSGSAGNDGHGNEIEYIIERMCRTENQVLSAANCVLSDGTNDSTSSMRVIPEPEAGACVGVNCTGGGGLRPPVYRVTVRVTGPKNTVSYVQAFVF